MTKNLIGHRLEIFFRDPELDTRGQLLRDKLNALDLSVTIDNLQLSEVYTLEGNFSPARLREVAGLLLNPVIHDVLIDESRPLGSADAVLEVGFLPGVTDNIAHSAAATLADAWGKDLSFDQSIYSSTVYYIEAKNLSDGDYRLIGRFLANALIERLHWKDRSTYVAEAGMDLVIPR